MRLAGALLLSLVCGGVLLGPALFRADPDLPHPDLTFAPPMPLRVVGPDGVRAPFYYPLRLVDRIERRFDEDRSQPLAVLGGGSGAAAQDEDGWMPIGGDALGRNVAARLLHGGRLSLAVAAIATLLALGIGTFVGGIAGLAGGITDDVSMRVAEFLVVLPALYVVLTFQSALPLVLSTPVLFVVLVIVLGLVGWPAVARGVRSIVARDANAEYAAAARAAGASPLRLLLVHLLPASAGWLVAQSLVLFPSFVLAEATLSFVGLGFAPPASSWGTMLQEAANVSAVADYPWVLSPAAALVAVVLGANLVAERD